MKKRTIFSVFILIFIVLGLFAACGDSAGTDTGSNDSGSNPTTPETKYTVKFEANGGLPVPDTQSISNDGKVTMPSAMTKTGYNFIGWYKEAGCTNQWDFSADTVSGNITLYAKWDFIISTPIPTPIPSTTLAEKLAWLRTNAERDSTYLLEITTAYEELAPQNLFYPGRNNITIRLKGIGVGRVIGCTSSSSSTPLFTIGDGVTLILEENLILCKDVNYSINSPAVLVKSGGTLIMNQSVKITKLYGSYGCVYVNGGTFTMNGGEISGNTFDNGGVYLSGGTFTMNGGEISGNTSYSGGGGVYMGGGTFTMNGGEISGNTSYNSNSGGGVYVRGGTFIKSGGIITGYTSDTVNGNVVKSQEGSVLNDKGHAVYVSSSRYRNTTAGEADQIDTTTGKGLSANGNSPYEQ